MCRLSVSCFHVREQKKNPFLFSFVLSIAEYARSTRVYKYSVVPFRQNRPQSSTHSPPFNPTAQPTSLEQNNPAHPAPSTVHLLPLTIHPHPALDLPHKNSHPSLPFTIHHSPKPKPPKVKSESTMPLHPYLAIPPAPAPTPSLSARTPHPFLPHFSRTALHRTAPHRTAPHRTAPHRTALHYTPPHPTTPHHTAKPRTAQWDAQATTRRTRRRTGLRRRTMPLPCTVRSA